MNIQETPQTSSASAVMPCWANDDGSVQLYHADCVDVLPFLHDIDAVITDPPYGTTENEWDIVPSLPEWWKEIKNVCRGAVVMTAAQPFTSEMVMSNRQWFKWADVWKKTQARGHLNAKVMPLRQHEDILVFGSGRITYNPQLVKKPACDIRPNTPRTKGTSNYGVHGLDSERSIPPNMSYPRSVVEIENCQEYTHPTQKPVKLFTNFVLQYTRLNETVLDPFMGSGTTGIACIRAGRKFIGIEKDEKYFEIAKKRIQKELQQGRLW